MKTVGIGAITRDIPESALKWYLKAGWKVIDKKEVKVDTNTKENATKSSNLPKVYK